jgi:6-phosphogluconolactonase
VTRDVELVVLPDPEAVAQAAAERLAEAAGAGAAIALSGGSTPRRALELAAQLEPSWASAAAWWGDERCVPPHDPRSNYRMAREALLDRLVRPPEVHRIRGELPAEEAAAAYEAELGDLRLDLALMGIGPDGHTASLFPKAPTLDERERRVVAAEPRLEPFVERVTLTLPALRASHEVLFVVTGAEKADAVRRAFAGEPSKETPASLLRADEGRTVAILDAAAARDLSAESD